MSPEWSKPFFGTLRAEEDTSLAVTLTRRSLPCLSLSFSICKTGDLRQLSPPGSGSSSPTGE